jgi:hypothetical protein
VNPAEMTEDEFLCTHDIIQQPNANGISASEMGAIILREMNVQSFSGFPILRVCGNFRIIRLAAGDTGLIDDQDNLVGYYIGEGLLIDPGPASKQGLSVPLILDALPQRPLPTRRKVSEGGEAALRKAWRVANKKEKCTWWTKA